MSVVTHVALVYDRYRTFIVLYSYLSAFFYFFFFNDTATTEIYTLSLHDALPISRTRIPAFRRQLRRAHVSVGRRFSRTSEDRKSTRLNSSHGYISYAVFCLKKKKIQDFDT